jgi:hypothetical protein
MAVAAEIIGIWVTCTRAFWGALHVNRYIAGALRPMICAHTVAKGVAGLGVPSVTAVIVVSPEIVSSRCARHVPQQFALGIVVGAANPGAFRSVRAFALRSIEPIDTADHGIEVIVGALGPAANGGVLWLVYGVRAVRNLIRPATAPKSSGIAGGLSNFDSTGIRIVAIIIPISTCRVVLLKHHIVAHNLIDRSVGLGLFA